MPPKKKGKGKGKKGKGKKGKGKKGKGKKGGLEMSGLIPSETMTAEELNEYVQSVREELEREREERNYFQLERDKINTFWEITKRQLEERKAEIRNKDRELEDAEEKHQNEIKVYKQKVKHLLYEHQNSISELKEENTVVLKMAQDNYLLSETELRRDKRALKVELKEKEIAHAQMLKNVIRKNDEREAALLTSYKRQLEEMESKHAVKVQDLRNEHDLQQKSKIHEIEERKNLQINNLIRNHDKAFSDIKNYYNDITLNNIALINTLKEQVESLQAKQNRLLKDMKELENVNKSLVDPLRKSQRKMMHFQVQLANYEKDKELLKAAKAHLKVLTEDNKTLKFEKEVLDQSLRKAQQERDELYNRFVDAIHEVQQKSDLKNLLLEKKLSALSEVLEKKEAQLNEVLSASALDAPTLALITRKLEDVLDSKNNAIKDLQFELARLCRAHDDLLHTCQTKLQQYGLSMDDLGFRPVKGVVRCPKLGHMQQF